MCLEKERFVEFQSMKPYPAYKASGIEWVGEIPAHWEVTKVKRITQIIYGESLSKDNRTDGTIPVYGSNGITGYHNEAITKNPCIIIGRKGSFGKINYSEVKCFPIDTTFYIDNSATNHHIRWLYYLLLVLRLDSFSKDSAVPGVNREEIYEREGLIPPLSEQRAIAAYLDHKTRLIDTYIAKKQQQVERWQAYRAALINQAVTKGLNPDAPMKASGIEWLGDIPAHWETTALKYILNVRSGEGISPNDIESDEGTYEVYGGNGFLGYTEKFNVSEQTLIIGRVGAKCGNVHLVKGEKWVSDNALVVKTEENYKFLYFLLTAMNLNNLANQNAQPLITGTMIKSQRIGIPDLDEQQTIAAYLDEQTAKIDTLAAATQGQLERLHAYRAALISEVVTGKIDVRGCKDSLENPQASAGITTTD